VGDWLVTVRVFRRIYGILEFREMVAGVVCAEGCGFLGDYFMGFYLRYGSIRSPLLGRNDGYGFTGMMDGVGRERGVR